VEGDYMINQWYLMQFECHIREFTSIDKKLVKALGRDLTDQERKELWQSLFKMLKRPDGSYIYPIPFTNDEDILVLNSHIYAAYEQLGMNVPPTTGIFTSMFPKKDSL
ncbi:MAG: hypothetical protein ACTSYI_12450, partial [Promethearchaeota archaeon]